MFLYFLFLCFFIVFIIIENIILVKRIKRFLGETEGKLRTKKDLEGIKVVINTSMKFGMFTLILNLLFLISTIVHIFVYRNIYFLLGLVLIGIIQFSLGIWGKNYEDRIKNIEIFEIEPDVKKTFQYYLEEWKKPQFMIKDEL